MVAVLGIPEVTLSIIIGVLAAIVYSLRVLVLMDRKIARVENHIEKIASAILREETRIEKMLKRKKPRKK
ncbi:hypothetical protein KY337_03715 [Candidatus Woesearchaeota archaeon]|nr:hypothetical protein [Candidatus Woesearchaeota archaeon]